MAVAAAVGLLAWVFVKPAPPRRVVIAAGPADGAYHAFATRYAETFAASKVTLEVRATAGTVENYKLLAAGEAQLAIAQGSVAPDGMGDKVRAIGSLYYEPVRMFVREHRVYVLSRGGKRQRSRGNHPFSPHPRPRRSVSHTPFMSEP